MAIRYMKRCSTSLIIREMKIKATVRHHLSPVRMAIIKKATKSKCRQGHVEKGTLVHCWWEWKLVPPLWKTVWKCLKKLKLELPYDLVIPLLVIYPTKRKTLTRKDICTSMFIEAWFTIAKIWKQPKCLIDEWIKQMQYTDTHTYTHTHTHTQRNVIQP